MDAKIVKYGDKSYKVVNGTYYHIDTPDRVITALEGARHNRWRIRLDYGDVKTGRSWGEVCDITGYVGRSTGKIKIPILVYNSRSFGGAAILDDCILSVRFSNKKEGGFLYRRT